MSLARYAVVILGVSGMLTTRAAASAYVGESSGSDIERLHVIEGLAQDSLQRMISRLRTELKTATLNGENSRILKLRLHLGQLFADIALPDSALKYYRLALMLADSSGDSLTSYQSVYLIASLFFDFHQTDSAEVYYRRALARATEAGWKEAQGASLFAVGTVFERRDQWDSTLVYFRRALNVVRNLNLYEDQFTTLLALARVSLAAGQGDSAVAYFRRAYQLSTAQADTNGIIRVLGDLGNYNQWLGRYSEAMDFFRAALALLEARAPGSPGTGRAMVAIANTFRNLSQIDSASLYFRRALNVLRGSRDSDGLDSALGATGRFYGSVGHPDSALIYYAEQLEMRRRTGGGFYDGQVMINIANTYSLLGRPDSAIAIYRQALPKLRAVHDRVGVGLALSGLGAVYSDVNTDSARTYLKMALEVQQALNDGNQVGTLVALALVFKDESMPDSAIAYLREAIQIESDSSDLAMIWNNYGGLMDVVGKPDSALTYFFRARALARSFHARPAEIRALANIAFTSHQGRALSPRNLRTAVAYYDSATALSAAMRTHAGSESNRTWHSEQYISVATMWPLAILALAGPGAAHMSLAAADRGKSQALLDELRNVASVPEFLLFDTVAGADLGQRADALIAPLVRSRSAAVYYLLTPVDTLITWLVLPSKAVRVYKQSVTTAELIRLIIEFRRLLYADSPQTLGLPDGSRIAERANTENSMEAADSVGKRLTDILLPEDVLDSLHSYTDIVIIPHGVLSMLPFAALPSDPVGVPLGIRFAIRYSPSLSLLSVASPRLTNQNGGATLRPALIVADPKMPVDPTSGDPFDPLGMSRVAAQSLARRLGTTALVDSVATETTIRQRMLSGRLIHLATHGVAYGSAEDSRRSFVVLARDSVNDGLLSVGEILDDSHLQLEGAELVVLSACQTGLGRVTLGEGTLGFQRAFLARGARRVLVSLWSVSEDATMFLLDRFYTHLLDASGQVSYSAALQKAQEDTRSRPEYQNPFFWAGFQLVGAP